MLRALIAAAVLGCHLQAASINLGFLSFDTLIPGADGAPGVNGFTIADLTGDPAVTGGSGIDPDFPVFSLVIFQSAKLTLTSAGQVATEIDLGDLGPGFNTPLSAQFPDTEQFASAVLTLVLGQAILQLADGSVFLADKAEITVTLLPAFGNSLIPGSDLALIELNGVIAPSGIPEPGTLGLVFCALGALAVARRVTNR